MITFLTNILHHNCLLDTTKPVIVGVSGGADSLYLLDVLVSGGYRPLAAHYNHLLRPEAGEDARLVGSIAHNLGIPFLYAEGDVAGFARSEGLSIEEAARVLRYRFLFEQAESAAAQAVAVAHHADDQVETVLMHLLRGAGPAGLTGMRFHSLPNPWSRSIPLVRPLLGIWKDDILAYMAGRGLTFAQDVTNQDTSYFRNRLRHELLPELAKYNPQISHVIWRMADVMREDFEIITQVVDTAWEDCQVQEQPGAIGFDLGRFAGYPSGVQRGLLRRAVSCLRPGLRDIGLEAVERARQLAAAPGPARQVDLAGGVYGFCETHRLWIARREDIPAPGNWPGLATSEPLEFPIPGTLDLAHGWRLRAEFVDATPEILQRAEANTDPCQAWLDAAALHHPLILRIRRSGDSFKPLGLGGHATRLTDFMINVKLPARARRTWPLVCSADEIVWIPGYRQNHTTRLTTATRQVAFLQLLDKGLML